MIVVVGRPEVTRTRTGIEAGGLVAAIARAAAAGGRDVQLLARVPDDRTGDLVLESLASAGVGHVATLRSPAAAVEPALDPADIELGLRYLTDVSVVVLTEMTDAVIAKVAVDAVAWSRGSLIAIVPAGSTDLPDLPAGATVLEGPLADPDGAFGAMVGGLAAALDDGLDAAAAFRATLSGQPAWTPVER